jgi:hypothetical protein
MAEEAAIENNGVSTEVQSESTVLLEMEVENEVSTEKTNREEGKPEKENGGTKREREEENEEEDDNLKKSKMEKSVEEERLGAIEVFLFNYCTIYTILSLFFSRFHEIRKKYGIGSLDIRT